MNFRKAFAPFAIFIAGTVHVQATTFTFDPTSLTPVFRVCNDGYTCNSVGTQQPPRISATEPLRLRVAPVMAGHVTFRKYVSPVGLSAYWGKHPERS